MQLPLNDIDIVFLAGGTCRIPFVKQWTKKIFPNAEIKIDGDLEIITATGAIIHALQVLSKEINPYISYDKHKVICTIIKCSDEFKVNAHNIRTQKSTPIWSYGKSIPKVIDELTKKYKKDIGIILIANDHYLKPEQLASFEQNDFEKYGNLIHLATNEELNFEYHLTVKGEYAFGDIIIQFGHTKVTIYQCTDVVECRVKWKQLDDREYVFTERIDLEYFIKLFHFRTSEVHVVFEKSEERINSIYGSELYKYNFKSINFIRKNINFDKKVLLLARHLVSDSEDSAFVKIEN